MSSMIIRQTRTRCPGYGQGCGTVFTLSREICENDKCRCRMYEAGTAMCQKCEAACLTLLGLGEAVT